MKKINNNTCRIGLLLVFIIMFFSFSSLSSSVTVRDYLEGKFPAIFVFYLASLEDLDESEREFIDLLEKLPENEQRMYIKEVYEHGFSEMLLDKMKRPKKKETVPLLNVAFPSQPEQRIGGSPLYIFGKTDPSPEVKVTVNGEEVEVFDPRTGHFLTLVEVPEDERFSLLIAASRGEARTVIEREVFYPGVWKEMPLNPLAIHSAHLQPSQDQVLRQGDELTVMIQGSPEAEAAFRIGDSPLEIPMREVDHLPEPLEGRGIYRASYMIQSEDIPLTGETLPKVITAILRRGNSEVSRELPGKIFFASDLPRHIVEVTEDQTRIYLVKKDAFVFHYSTPGGNGLPVQLTGYDIPPGTLFEVAGKAGDYLRIKLGSEEYLIHRKNVRELENIITKPFTTISRISANETPKEIIVRLNTRKRIPFLIEDEHQVIRLILYGGVEGVNMKLEKEGPSIEKIETESPLREEIDEPVLVITVRLNQPLGGFDYHWEGTELVLRLRKPNVILDKKSLKGQIIVIDPGHGGEDPGAIGPGDIHEKDVVLEIGSLLRNMLEEKGAEVIMTRSGDESIDLNERIHCALEHDADLFVSIHANAHAVGSDAVNYHGHMTIYNYGFNQKLAEIMLNNLVERIGLPPARVWQRSDLVVLRRPQVPGVLIETGFMMHPDDNWFLLQPEGQKEFASAIMDGISNYFQNL